MKVKPGISEFDGRPDQAGASILPLVKLAARLVPVEAQRTATVLLRATAGMRLLPRRRAQRIYDSLVAAVAENSGFAPKRDAFGTLPGDDEGVFGWLSANFLIFTDTTRCVVAFLSDATMWRLASPEQPSAAWFTGRHRRPLAPW
eukprot:6618259-Prymnesium_polylepis.1